MGSPPLRLLVGFGLGWIARDRLPLSATNSFVLAVGDSSDSIGMIGTLVAGFASSETTLEPPFFCRGGVIRSLIVFASLTFDSDSESELDESDDDDDDDDEEEEENFFDGLSTISMELMAVSELVLGDCCCCVADCVLTLVIMVEMADWLDELELDELLRLELEDPDEEELDEEDELEELLDRDLELDELDRVLDLTDCC